ncbi:aldehyde dehydrogenase family protein [Cupriavidus basilensis]
MGPIISERQMRRVLSYVDVGREDGGHLLLGGSRVGDTGYFVEPTVFCGSIHSDADRARGNLRPRALHYPIQE